jgi:PGF-pre-PGF domain-containing protein
MKRLVLALLVLFILGSVNATVTSIRLVDYNGAVANLKYDIASFSYADASVANPNMFVQICAGSAADIQNKYIGLVYKEGNHTVLITTTFGALGDLIKITDVNASNCATVDVDLSSFSAFYPAIPETVLSDNSIFEGTDSFFNLSIDGIWLNGTFNTTKYDAGTTVDVNVTEAHDQNGNSINTINKLVVGIARDDTGEIIDSTVTSLGIQVTLNKGSYSGDVTVFVNGINTTAAAPPTPPAIGAGGGGIGVIQGGGLTQTLCTLNEEVLTADKMTEHKKVTSPDAYCLDLHLSELTSNKNLTSVVITTMTYEEPTALPKLDKTVTGYFRVTYSDIEKNDVESAVFTYRVPKTFTVERNIDRFTIQLYRFDGTNWITGTDNFVSEDDSYYYFRATSPSLSYFAIAGERMNIWAVLRVIDSYYIGKATFLDVIEVVDKYYTSL